MNMHEFKTIFEELLHLFVSRQLAHAVRDAHDIFLKSMLQHSANLILHGGKRLRPYLVFTMMGPSDISLEQNSALTLLIGIELFHTFCLIHDDIMDHGTKRHGLPTITMLSQKARKSIHHSQSMAILAGDLVFAWAVDALRQYRGPHQQQVADVTTTLMREVIVGQMIDVNLSTKPLAASKEIKRKMIMKTARYSFVRPMQIGAILGNRPDLLPFCEKFGTDLGMAFQLKDDLLDLIETEQSSLKSRQSDLEQNQHTLISQHLRSHDQAESILYAERLLKTYFKKAEQQLETISLGEETKKSLFEVLSMIKTQSY